jgi:hypothetical protein
MANAVGRLLSETERAYLAGFIDGDGAIMAVIERHREKRFGFRVRIIVKATQLKENELEVLLANTGIGTVQLNRRAYDWIIKDQKSVQWLLEMISPYLRCKSKQVRLASLILKHQIKKKEDLYKVARLADTLSSFNVRSKNRRKNFATILLEKKVVPVTTDSKEEALVR